MTRASLTRRRRINPRKRQSEWARGVIAIGASAGGVEALQALVAGLPAKLPATVLVILHIPRQTSSTLPGIWVVPGSCQRWQLSTASQRSRA